jgi:Tol biopolymer transport system component
MRRFTRLIIAVVALALVLSGPMSLLPGGGGLVPVPNASAAFPGANGKIAFVSNRDGGFQVFVMDADGGNPTRLTDQLSNFMPTWSPDGSKIAFQSNRAQPSPSVYQIYVIDADGSNQTRLTDIPSPFGAHDPTWSPDGTRIAFTSTITGNGEIYVIDADGGDVTQLTNDGDHKEHIAWSPDGSKIAYTNWFKRDIYTINADGTNPTNLTNVPDAMDSRPDWSPDGSKIVFDSRRDGPGVSVYVMNADGSNVTRLTHSIDHQPAWSPDGNKIAYSGDNQIFVIEADGSKQTNLTNDSSINVQPSWQPVLQECALLLVPGIAGTYAAENQDVVWLLNRGRHPDQLKIDPMGRVYHDLITTLENTGYTQGQDFFVVNYDWRLPPAPFDGSIDGQITGLTGASITNTTFEHSVDYFGHYLRKAVEAHEAESPGSELDCVDVIAHSTGGLVTRSYIQSTAYQDSFTSVNGERTLPRVNEFIMLGVPNRGASKAWNPLHDNWVIDPVYSVVLSKIVYRAWLKVTVWNIHINGPDHTITRASITNAAGEYDPMLFIEQYVPTIGSLLATYDFLDTGSGFTSVNSDPERRNNLLLDLNDGLDFTGTADPSPFANLSNVTAIYGTDHATATGVIQRIGPHTGNGILPFSAFLPRVAEPGEVWYQDIQPPASGDETVPIDSAAGQFFGDERVTLIPLSAANTTGKTDHTGLVGNPDVQAGILDILGKSFEPGDIASGTGLSYTTALSVIFDPVEGFLVDGSGDRLGYTDATGPVTEIPGSLWFGDSDGFGLIDGPVLEPMTLSLSGLDKHHVVVVSYADDQQFGGALSEGFLGSSEEFTVPVVIGEDHEPSDPGDPDDPEGPDDPGDEERTADERLQELIDYLAAMDMHAGIKQSRLGQLTAAQASLERGNEQAACNQLRAFINSVNAQQGKHLSPEQADDLTKAAEGVREALGC